MVPVTVLTTNAEPVASMKPLGIEIKTKHGRIQNHMRQINPKVELASGEYDLRKRKGLEPGIAPVARLFGIQRRKLDNYRANYISRKSR
jgi:hypothetical protein